MKKYLNNLQKCNIIPCVTTNIVHRLTDCSPYHNAIWVHGEDEWNLTNAKLPLFTAPMSCVVDDKNYSTFINEKITPIIPRNISFERRMELAKEGIWIAVGLDEFEKIINTIDSFENDTYMCVDIANGHMSKLLGLCKQAKHKFNNLILMTGNIANASTYQEYARIGIDYVRVGIGSGSACSTNSLTGVGSSTFRLLCDLKWEQQTVIADSERLISKFKSIPAIIYDGGCDSIRDIIMALALGANYVMCGKLFAQSEEACGKIIPKKVTKVVEEYFDDHIEDVEKTTFVDGRLYYGMSTVRAQIEMGNAQIKASEGIETWIPILYTLHDWVNTFIAALTSSMSYCNARILDDFIGKVNVVLDR